MLVHPVSTFSRARNPADCVLPLRYPHVLPLGVDQDLAWKVYRTRCIGSLQTSHHRYQQHKQNHAQSGAQPEQ
ncbi:Uncharacterised protein [Vibrio cholerae]|uniref:Uncharacterized protein n=1 Tax=Vibrio cholerae TaxID=666 RepID=A0A655PC11_VIBCL|nr:Uncharacterised protein [Vibrio cholerae]CSA01123.1 Uncharacterised protein [Vibrio cholerae]CSC13904.1 Uncharacterised protein [Vibrio cholerae]CSC47242.1 Uncharacterised protein [Vibrio cholerae]CSC97788.1 Uncharacterised protein [Vibrio cholerae]